MAAEQDLHCMSYQLDILSGVKNKAKNERVSEMECSITTTSNADSEARNLRIGRLSGIEWLGLPAMAFTAVVQYSTVYL